MRLLILLVLIVFPLFANAPERSTDWEKIWKERKIEKAKEKRIDNLLETIRHQESRNRYHIRGSSGEYGAYQFMPSTWEIYSYAYAGEVLNITCEDNQDKVARYKVESLVEEGLSDREIALVWNAGTTDAEGWEGINSYGHYYNVSQYADNFVNHMSNLKNEYINYV